MSEGQQASSPPSVAVGRYRLELDAGEGVFALFQPQPEQEQAEALRQALAAGEAEPAAAATDELEAVLGQAASISERCQRCVRLFTEIAEGSRDPHAISDEVDALLALLGRLDREGQHKEALRLARDLAALLALLLRWLDLVRSLRLALKAARALGDEPALEAWALHELGSLHLAAGDAATAAEQLEQAATLKERLGSRGRCASRHNLDAARRDLAERAMLATLRRRGLFRLGLIGATFLLLGGGGIALGISTGSSRPVAASVPTTTTATITAPTTTAATTATATTTPTTTTLATPTGVIPPTTTTATTTTPTTTAATVVDTTPPAPTLSEPADGSFLATATPTFSGGAGNDSGDSPTITVSISDSSQTPAGGSPLTTSRDGATFAVSVPDATPLADGSYSAQVTQTDDAGNTGASATITFAIDTTPPTITLKCSLRTSVCAGTASELDQPVTITITDQGPAGAPPAPISSTSQTVTVSADGAFTTPLTDTAPNEQYQVIASQADAAGNTGTSTAQLTTAVG